MSPVTVTTGETIASFWWRFVAFIIDSIILGLVVLIPLRASNLSFYAASVAQVVAAFLYFGLFVRYWGQTPGMRVFRMRCLSADGTKVSPSQAYMRAGVYSILLLVGSLYQRHVYTHPTTAENHAFARSFLIYLVFTIPHYLDLLWAAWDKQRQTLHDKAPGTIVVRSTIL
jgi:uncharacterized RDD family membrane protein YckC